MCLDLKSDNGKGVKKLAGHLSVTDKQTNTALYYIDLRHQILIQMAPCPSADLPNYGVYKVSRSKQLLILELEI